MDEDKETEGLPSDRDQPNGRSFVLLVVCRRLTADHPCRLSLGIENNFIKTTYDISLDSLHLFVTKRILSSLSLTSTILYPPKYKVS